nr:50S ribosomal protein L3 [Deltaproteobacteria bacterium]
MALGLIGQKVGMTHVFTPDGEAIAVTIIAAGPCTVVTTKNKDKHGYEAIQVGFGTQKESRIPLPVRGQFKKANVAPCRVLKEFRVDDAGSYEVGQQLTVDLFKAGEKVSISSRTKGRGFTGVVKRHGFKGGAGGHGSMFHRAPGSIGASADPSRVLKGKRLPGHYGDDRLTIRNMTIIDVNAEENLLLVKGSVPGGKRSMVLVKKNQ